MPLFVTSDLPAPAHWQEFQSLVHDLARRLWGESTQLNGSEGQEQTGVDIYAHADGAWIGLQAKRKRRYPERRLTTSTIREEVSKALQFDPSLGRFIIATTATNA